MYMMWILLLVFLLQGLDSSLGRCHPPKKTCGTTTTTTTARPTTFPASIATTVSKDSSEKSQISQIVYISVPVIVIIVATIGGLILCLKRKGFQLSFTRVVCRRKRSSEKHNAGIAMTNTTYENTDASLKEKSPTTQALDSGYTEISSNLAENPDNVYQTIDVLPEDQTVSTNTYGHLKVKDFGFDSKTYSHISANQAVITTKQRNMDYSHVEKFGTKSHEANIDSTYNILHTCTISRHDKAKGTAEIKNAEDEETEYDHAVAGGAESVSANKRSSEYAHLKTRAHDICTSDRVVNRADMTSNREHGMRTLRYSEDTEKPITAKASVDSPIYSKVNKTSTNTSRCKDASRKPDDEFAVKSPHFYFTLERERNTQCNKAVSFRIAENEAADECEVYEHEGSNRHDYFILEAQQ